MPINRSQVNAIIFVLCFGFASVCRAIGLGDIKVYSYLDEPLVAEIVLKDLRGIDPNRLIVGLASSKDFARASMDRPYFLTSLAFDIVTYNDQVLVYIRSLKPVKTPYLEFLLELSWPDGSLIKDYTALIDPPPPNLKSATRAKALSQLAIEEAEQRTFGAVEAAPQVIEKPKTSKKNFSDQDSIDFTSPSGPVVPAELIPNTVPDIDEAPAGVKPAVPPVPATPGAAAPSPAPGIAVTAPTPAPGIAVPAPAPAPAAPSAKTVAPATPTPQVVVPTPVPVTPPPAPKPVAKSTLDAAIIRLREVDENSKIDLDRIAAERLKRIEAFKQEVAAADAAEAAAQAAQNAQAAAIQTPVAGQVAPTAAGQAQAPTPTAPAPVAESGNPSVILFLSLGLLLLALGVAVFVKVKLKSRKSEFDTSNPDSGVETISEKTSTVTTTMPAQDNVDLTENLEDFEQIIADTDLDQIIEPVNAASVESETIVVEDLPLSEDQKTLNLKIELAKQYLAAGDKDSARATLQEVIEQAKDQQKIEAELLLSSII